MNLICFKSVCSPELRYIEKLKQCYYVLQKRISPRSSHLPMSAVFNKENFVLVF